MRRLLLLVLFVLAGCRAAELPEDVRSRREAFVVDPNPDFQGAQPGDNWGWELAPCSTGNYVVSAPTLGEVIVGPVSTAPTLGRGDGFGLHVGCMTVANLPFAVAGTGNGAYAQDMMGGFQAFGRDAGVYAIAGGAAGPLLVATQGNVITFFKPNTPPLPLPGQFTVDAGASLISSLAWDPSFRSNQEAYFAVGLAASAKVILYARQADAGVRVVTQYAPPQGTLMYGSAIAFGNVHPAAGSELVVAADGTLFVYATNLPGTEPPLLTANYRAGASAVSVAIEPQSEYGELDAVWVGRSEFDVVYRFIGDAGTSGSVVLAPSPRFGHSIAAVQGRAWLGAPFFATGAGAVFSIDTTTASVPGNVEACQGGCSLGACGSCYGGVFCMNVCAADAGVDGGATNADGGMVASDGGMTTPDGGSSGADAGADGGSAPGDAGTDGGLDTTDGGVKRDAGTGGVDGGKDGGVSLPTLVFTPAGCTTVDAWPLGVVALLLARRARR